MGIKEKQLDDARGNVLSRRSFLKTAGGLAAAGALGSLVGCAPNSEAGGAAGEAVAQAQTDQLFCGSCRAVCMQDCFMDYHVRDGKVVRTSMHPFPDETYNRICLKGMSQAARVNDPNRLKYPMRRTGERGSGDWERISWEEAIQTITDTWKKDVQEYGPNAVAYMQCQGGMQGALVFSGATERLRYLTGGVLLRYPMDMMPYYSCFNSGAGNYNSTAGELMVGSKRIIVCGNDLGESQPQSYHWVYEAQQAGAKLIVIDPVYTTIASKADIWLPVRPGSDGALFLGMVNYAQQKGLVDEEFLRNETVAPYLVKEDGRYLRMSDLGVEPLEIDDPATGGKTTVDPNVVFDKSGKPVSAAEAKSFDLNGTYSKGDVKAATVYSLFQATIDEWDVERAAQVCDVPADDIRAAAEMFLEEPDRFYIYGYGQDKRWNACQAYACAGAFLTYTGSLKKVARDSVPYDTAAISYPQDLAPLAPLTWLAPSQLPAVLETGKYGDMDVTIKVLICQAADPFHSTSERDRLIKALDNIDLLVAINASFNDTSQYADIVLPVCDWCETEEVQASNYIPFFEHQQKAIDPQFESKSDFEICKLLAEGLGHPEWFDLTPEDILRTDLGNDLYEQIMKEHVVRASTPTLGAGAWGTMTGKVEFYSEVVPAIFPYAPYGQQQDVSKRHLPSFEMPHLAWNQDAPGFPKNPLAEKYPYTAISPHKRWHTHTSFSFNPIVRELDPEPTAYLNETDAQAHGIAEGDYVRLFNDYGEAVMLAHIHNGVRPGLLVCPNGWTAKQYVRGHFNNLASVEADPNSENQTSSDILFDIEKYEGA